MPSQKLSPQPCESPQPKTATDLPERSTPLMSSSRSSHAVPERYSSAPVFHVGQPTSNPS